MSSKFTVWCRACGCQMRLRRGKRGYFYGCTAYPICKHTMSELDAALAAEVPEPVEYDDPSNDDKDL